MGATDMTLCGSAAAVVQGGSIANWVNPGNAAADDGSMATATLASPGNSNFIYCSAFGFSIPAGRSITGFDVYVADCVQNVTGIIVGMTLNGTSVSGTTHGSGQLTLSGIVGGPLDRWGIDPSITQVTSSTFGCLVYASGASGNVSLDAVFMKVYYSDTASDSVPVIAGRVGR